jgi:hypothetical protein
MQSQYDIRFLEKETACMKLNFIQAALQKVFLELLAGIEPATPSLPRTCSTSEPQQQIQKY